MVSLEGNGHHRPVLVDAVVDLSQPFRDQASTSYLDLTAGRGGHADAIVSAIRPKKITLVDCDSTATAFLQTKFRQATIHHEWAADFLKMAVKARQRFDLILADLGWSSDQIMTADRGFSWQRFGRLDMRFNQDQGQPLVERLATVSQKRLAQILKDYGEEPQADKIATAIKRARPETTTELAKIVVQTKRHRRRHHPATTVFQALRIWINDELEQLSQICQIAPLVLSPGGRLLIISFHSLEDRLVKNRFRHLSQPGYDQAYEIVFKKPLRADRLMIADQPQARSAKLRCLQRRP